jgi:hypothetical protein
MHGILEHQTHAGELMFHPHTPQPVTWPTAHDGCRFTLLHTPHQAYLCVQQANNPDMPLKRIRQHHINEYRVSSAPRATEDHHPSKHWKYYMNTEIGMVLAQGNAKDTSPNEKKDKYASND